MFPGSLRDLTFQMIKNLSLLESETLDYKEEIENSDKGKRDFSKDVCAFANTEGGDLVIGVKEQNFAPAEFPGIDSPTEEEARLTDIIVSRIEPRIHGISFKAIDIEENGKKLLIVRIPKSYNGPHFENSKRIFYQRHHQRNDLMSWKEISEVFLSRRNVFDKIHAFLNGRIQGFFQPIGTIDYRNLGPPVALFPGLTVIFHLIPIQAFEKKESLNAQDLRTRYGNTGPFPLLMTREGMYWEEFSRLNIDGILRYQAPGHNETYTQMFRNGSIEAVRVYRFSEGTTSLFPILRFEDEARRWLRASIERYGEIGINPPFFFTALIKDGMGSVIDTRRPDDQTPFLPFVFTSLDRNPLFLPEIFIENPEVDLDRKLEEFFTALWNAYGWSRPSP